MARRTYILNISHSILLITGLCYFINYLLNGRLGDALMLNPNEVINHYQVWRLITFPFANSTVEGILLFSFTFWIISPKLEEYFHKLIYPIVLFLLICLEGTVLTLIYWKSNMTFSGMEGVSLFILTIFTMLQLSNKIVLWRFQPVKPIIFIVLLTLTWLSSVFIHSMLAHKEIFYSTISSSLFGLTSGMLVYLQTRVIKGIKSMRANEGGKVDIPTPEEISVGYSTQKENRLFSKNPKEDTFLPEPDFYLSELSEDRLNEILDKINEYGQDSLSPEENFFLKEYSRKLS